jgi:hypothetical protein
MEIMVHIERLVLEGISLPAGGAAHLQAALETELARLLAEGGLSPLLASGGVLRGLSAGEIHLNGGSPTCGPEAGRLGQQIAQSVYRGIGR